MELLPCPFCGEAAQIVGEFELDVVACQTCYARTDAFAGDDGDYAAAAWNRRATNAANAPADPALLALDRELRIRNLIAEREFNTAAANREIAQFGEWRWDHDAADKACADAIARLLAPDGAASEGVTG